MVNITAAAVGLFGPLGDGIGKTLKTGSRITEAAKGSAGGERAGKSFTPKGKADIDAANAERNGGVNACETCGTNVVAGQKSERGVTPPGNQRERDHIIPKSKGGDGVPSNGQVLCRNCNLKKSDKVP